MKYGLAAHPVLRGLLLAAATLALGASLGAGNSASAAGPHGFAGGGARGFGAGPHGFAAARGGRAVPGYAWRGYGWRGYGWGPGWGLYWGLGLYLPVLPLYYSTYWWGGVPYYYANNYYYEWNPSAGEYEAVVPPAGLTQQTPGASPANPGAPGQDSELFAYPKNGQSPAQQATDKRQCRAWARAQMGAAGSDNSSVPSAADPTGAANGSGAAGADTRATAVGALQQAVAGADASPPSGTPDDARAPQRLATAEAPGPAERESFLRAETACLTGRGYSVQ